MFVLFLVFFLVDVYLCSHLPSTPNEWVPILDFYLQGFHFRLAIKVKIDLSTLASSTLIISFSKRNSSKSKSIVKDNSEIFRDIPFVEMIFSKLINYLTNVC